MRVLCVQGGARSGSEALSSAVLNIEKGKMEREVQAQVSIILSSPPSSNCFVPFGPSPTCLVTEA